MRLLLTGLSGTLAPKLAQAAVACGHDVLGWARDAVDLNDAAAVDAYVQGCKPQAIAHLALGPVAWAKRLALHAAAHQIPLLVTSSAMVFERDGPHHTDDQPAASDGYGRCKIEVEEAVRAACPRVCVARLGWQIHGDAQGNNMLAHLDRMHAQQGHIGASRLWRPACSFMDDTADALLTLLCEQASGVVHLDSNARDGHAFDEIVRALAVFYGRTHWRVRPDQSYRHDQRLLGGEARMPGLRKRLANLGKP
jgi:dTDP-4-dehydrorhamnose reductase